ncbi:hypothetical protein FS749_011684 [Ceratobasidium sp. UAMH 11750]|nr:hypothetical protein FS749_011684 [Ceratobasidium sp. UAMH 11750]
MNDLQNIGDASISMQINSNYEDLPTPHFGYPTQPSPIATPDGLSPEDVLVVDNISFDYYFVVTGNIYRLFANGTIQLHRELNPPAQIPISPNPVKPASWLHVGVLPFYMDELFQLYSVQEEQNTLKPKPKPVFNTEDEARVSLGIGENPIPSTEHNLLAKTSPTVPFDSILDSNLTTVFDTFNPGPSGSSITSESCAPTSTSESNTTGEYPSLLSSPGSEILADGFASPELSSPHPTTPPPLPPSSPGETEVDEHVISLKAKRRSRGMRPSPISLQCPKCGRICRRPHVLSEHMKSVHLELRTFKCPRVGCTKDFTTSSNRTRHLKKCSFPEE